MSSKRAVSLLAVAASVLFAAGSATAASESASADISKECVGTDAPKTLSTCPGGPEKFDVERGKHAAAFKSAPPPAEVKKRQDDAAKRVKEHVDQQRRAMRELREQRRRERLAGLPIVWPPRELGSF